MTRISVTEVMIEHNSKLARDPVHLRRLVTFWPEENIVHQLAKQALEQLTKQSDYEYIVTCHSYTGPAWPEAGKDGPAWYFEGSDHLVDNDEVTAIRKVINEWDVKAEAKNGI